MVSYDKCTISVSLKVTSEVRSKSTDVEYMYNLGTRTAWSKMVSCVKCMILASLEVTTGVRSASIGAEYMFNLGTTAS